MWGKFGEVTFKLLKTPEAFSRSSRAKFARISLFGEKEKLHFTGLEPEIVELSVVFHSSFCDPQEELELLRNYLSQGDSHLLIVGDYIKGFFSVESLREEVRKTNKAGNPLEISVNLTLREDSQDVAY